MKVIVRKFEMRIHKEKGITVIDHRHKPPRKCGTLSWKYIMNMIEDCYSPPEIHPGGVGLY